MRRRCNAAAGNGEGSKPLKCDFTTKEGGNVMIYEKITAAGCSYKLFIKLVNKLGGKEAAMHSVREGLN